MTSPKPFLRRGSRKEPSALNKRIDSPSMITKSHSMDNGMQTWDDNRDLNRSSTNLTSGDRFSHTRGVAYAAIDSCEVEGDDILLSGGDYWRLDSSAANEKPTAFKSTAQRPPLANPYSRSGSMKFDPMTETADDGGDWSRIRREESDGRDLDEFVMLERQLEDISTAHLSRPQSATPARPPFSRTSSSKELEKPQASGSQQNLNRTGNQGNAMRPMARQNPTEQMDSRYNGDNSDDELEKSLVGHTQYQKEPELSDGRNDIYSGGDDLELQIRHVRPVMPRRDSARDSNTAMNRSASASASRERPLETKRPPVSAGRASGKGAVGAATNSGSNSYGHNNGNSNGNGNGATREQEEMRRYLTEKAKELEAELVTYRQENAALKKLRKEQENLLSDKRSEVHKWALEERQKTETWCEEQKQAAARERSASAKIARENRLALGGTGTLGVRKERAEIEALQATLEKLKIDADTKEKKWKMNERRLSQLSKDNSSHAEDMQQQVSMLEQNRQEVYSYLDSIGVRLPGSLCRALGPKKGDLGFTTGTPNKPPNLGFGSTSAPREGSVSLPKKASTSHNLYQKAGSTSTSTTRTLVGTYAVEVDPEHLEVPSERRAPRTGGAGGGDRDGYASETGHRGALASAIFNGNSNRDRDCRTNHSDVDDEDDRNMRLRSNVSRPPSEYFEQQLTETATMQRTVSGTTLPAGLAAGMADRAKAGLRNVLGIDNDLKASWARSSRSSRGSRYSGDDEDNFDDDFGPHREAAAVTSLEFADTVKATHSAAPEYSRNDRTSPRADTGELSSSRALDYSNYDKTPARPGGAEAFTSNSNPYARKMSTEAVPAKPVPEVTQSAGRTEETLPDGRRLISYRNGTRKELLPNGESLVRFVNGDSKTTGAGNNGVVVYYYAQADTTHTTYKDGLEVYEFPNQQVEKHFPNGTKEILFPDHTRKLIYADGVQESFFPDGVVVKELPDGTREISSRAA